MMAGFLVGPVTWLMYLAICLFISPLAVATEQAAAQETPAKAALAGLESLREFARQPSFKETYKFYGFEAPDQVRDLSLGKELQVQAVRYGRLRDYDPQIDPEEVLYPAGAEIIYPILVAGVVKTSLSVSFSPKTKTWKTTSWGRANLIRKVALLKQYQHSQTTFIVWFPAFNLYILGDRSNKILTLTPIYDYPDLDLQADSALDARQLFLKVKLLTQIHTQNKQ